MIEFIGLRPKLYIYKMHEGKEECKGVKKNAIKKITEHQHFKESFHWKPTNE